MLAKMRKVKTKPDIRTYELLFSLFGNVNAPYEKGNLLSHANVTQRINTIEMDMLQNGIQHSQRSMNNLVLEDKPDQSRWTLRYKAFDRDIVFSWLARNLQPIPNQKIHWRSMEGLPNSGAVRFYPRGPSSCLIELTVSYEVPQLLSPVASVNTFFQIILVAAALLQPELGTPETQTYVTYLQQQQFSSRSASVQQPLQQQQISRYQFRQQ